MIARFWQFLQQMFLGSSFFDNIYINVCVFIYELLVDLQLIERWNSVRNRTSFNCNVFWSNFVVWSRSLPHLFFYRKASFMFMAPLKGTSHKICRLLLSLETWRSHSEKLHNLYPANCCSVIRSHVGHVAHMAAKINAYIFVVKSDRET
jgi:hypothetical protein